MLSPKVLVQLSMMQSVAIVVAAIFAAVMLLTLWLSADFPRIHGVLMVVVVVLGKKYYNLLLVG